MKLIINYDFYEAILNVKEPMGPLKVIRNNKRQWAKIDLPIFTILDLIMNSVPETIIILPAQFGFLTLLNLLPPLITKIDPYKTKSSDDLKRLRSKLKDLNINTDCDLLLESELYKKEYKIKVNEKNLPYIAESKYIMVPTYNFNGEVSDTSILQEHVVGSKEYVLSIGSPKKEYKVSYAKAY